MIAIGHIAKTYGVLPSRVLAEGTTFDLMVADVYTTWEQYQQNPNSASNFSQEDLQQAMEKVKK